MDFSPTIAGATALAVTGLQWLGTFGGVAFLAMAATWWWRRRPRRFKRPAKRLYHSSRSPLVAPSAANDYQPRNWLVRRDLSLDRDPPTVH